MIRQSLSDLFLIARLQCRQLFDNADKLHSREIDFIAFPKKGGLESQKHPHLLSKVQFQMLQFAVELEYELERKELENDYIVNDGVEDGDFKVASVAPQAVVEKDPAKILQIIELPPRQAHSYLFFDIREARNIVLGEKRPCHFAELELLLQSGNIRIDLDVLSQHPQIACPILLHCCLPVEQQLLPLHLYCHVLPPLDLYFVEALKMPEDPVITLLEIGESSIIVSLDALCLLEDFEKDEECIASKAHTLYELNQLVQLQRLQLREILVNAQLKLCQLQSVRQEFHVVDHQRGLKIAGGMIESTVGIEVFSALTLLPDLKGVLEADHIVVVEVEQSTLHLRQKVTHLLATVGDRPVKCGVGFLPEPLGDEFAEPVVDQYELVQASAEADVFQLDVHMHQTDGVEGQNLLPQVGCQKCAPVRYVWILAVLHCIGHAVSVHEQVKAQLPAYLRSNLQDRGNFRQTVLLQKQLQPWPNLGLVDFIRVFFCWERGHFQGQDLFLKHSFVDLSVGTRPLTADSINRKVRGY